MTCCASCCATLLTDAASAAAKVNAPVRVAPARPRNARRLFADLVFVFMAWASRLLGPVEPANIECAGIAGLRADTAQAQSGLAAVIADAAVVHRSRIDDQDPERAVAGFLEPVE